MELKLHLELYSFGMELKLHLELYSFGMELILRMELKLHLELYSFGMELKQNTSSEKAHRKESLRILISTDVEMRS